MTNSSHPITTAIAWCIAWGDQRQPQFDLTVLQQMRQALNDGKEVPEKVRSLVKQVKQLQAEDLKFPQTLDELKQWTEQHPTLWSSRIGLVYGGATKIKQYVFEAAKLPDIRGASALLDRINIIDLPAFFSCEQDSRFPQCQRATDYCQKVRRKWLDLNENFPTLSAALIPELIIYSTGGNILAFCPAVFVEDVTNAIEKRYTQETLTANSCAVGAKFKLLEIRFGLLQDPIDRTFWLEQYLSNQQNSLVRAYFDQPNVTNPYEAFRNRKSFNELAGKLAAQFNQRRSGNDLAANNRPSRRYPPMFETHPYLRRDGSERRSAVVQAKRSPDDPSKGLPGDPWFSEPLARKRLVGQKAKREDSSERWYRETGFEWEPGAVESWVYKFEQFLDKNSHRYYDKHHPKEVKEARTVREIADASTPKGFVAYIYADGNNMGGYIQREIKTPEDYQHFSEDVFNATEESVYAALEQYIKPHKLKPDLQFERQSQTEVWIHPFEILTIGGDDVMLIVPANKALAIAQKIGEEFEARLLKVNMHKYRYKETYNPELVHRYQSRDKFQVPEQCKLSMSIGVLITAEDTPIYYAEKLTSQLLKSAKKRAKELKQKAKELKQNGYYGGTVDFLVMKTVTMISSNIGEFRGQGLTKNTAKGQKLKLYASPYTLYEIEGLIKTVKALKAADFPRSQLYQIRSLTEQGKNTAMLNYRYFRIRLKQGQTQLKETFEDGWCQALTNNGNLAPWMSDNSIIINNLKILIFFETFPLEEFRLQYVVLSFLRKVSYETIWRELVDLYPFIEDSENTSKTQQKQGIEITSS